MYIWYTYLYTISTLSTTLSTRRIYQYLPVSTHFCSKCVLNLLLCTDSLQSCYISDFSYYSKIFSLPLRHRILCHLFFCLLSLLRKPNVISGTLSLFSSPFATAK